MERARLGDWLGGDWRGGLARVGSPGSAWLGAARPGLAQFPGAKMLSIFATKITEIRKAYSRTPLPKRSNGHIKSNIRWDAISRRPSPRSAVNRVSPFETHL